eukprot:3086223-Amphidinium_carterae.1
MHSVALCTWNIGSWRQRSSQVIAHLKSQPLPSVACLQETGLTIDGQRSATEVTAKLGWGMVHGTPCPVTKVRNKFYRTSRSSGAGLSIVYPIALNVSVIDCLSSSLRVYVNLGRV